MKYILHNKSSGNIQIIVPAPHGSHRSSACFTIPKSGSLDILPFAGSIQACRRIAFIRDLECRNLLDVTEEP